MWQDELDMHPELDAASVGYALINIVRFMKFDTKTKKDVEVNRTATRVSKGCKRLYKNLKWWYRKTNGKLTQDIEALCVNNAIQWTQG